MLRRDILESSRGRIVALLRQGPMTVDQLASQIGLTANAVRAQISAMQRDGLVHRTGLRSGTTRPSHVFELTPEVDHLLSRAYIPFVTHLLHVFATEETPARVNKFMRKAGKALAAELPVAKRPAGGPLRARAAAASRLLNEELGALTHVVKANGGFAIRGVGCPLSAVTGKHPAVCLAIESLVGEIVRAPVRECCNRTGRPKCCFEIGARG
jgi:predicted ArsR family transcriptional regulator